MARPRPGCAVRERGPGQVDHVGRALVRDVALGGGGLRGIVDSPAELIGRPVLIENGVGQIAAAVGDPIRLPAAELRRSLPIDGGPTGAPGPVGPVVGPGAAGSVGPGAADPSGPSAGFLVWSVVVAGDVAARIWCPSTASRSWTGGRSSMLLWWCRWS
jgi:hypothetical protein